MSVLFN